MFPTDCVPRNWEIRLTQALAKGTVGGRLPVLMGAPRFPPPLPASTYDVKGTLAPESEEGKLRGRGPLTFHPHPNVGVRLDCSHFEETEAQRGRGPGPGSHGWQRKRAEPYIPDVLAPRKRCFLSGPLFLEIHVCLFFSFDPATLFSLEGQVSLITSPARPPTPQVQSGPAGPGGGLGCCIFRVSPATRRIR